MEAAAGGSNPLGTFVKYSAGQENQRDTLRRAAQRLLFDPSIAAEAQHRTVWCARTVLGEGVSLLRAIDGSSARTGGLHTCSSIWTCAVCSAKVTERRRAELLAGMTAWRAMGGHRNVLLQTQTFPHERDALPLPELLSRFADAQKRFKQSTAYKRIAKLIAREGGVRSLEVTFGEEHGWHPHTHELVFAGVDLATLPGVEVIEVEGNRWRYTGGIVDELRDAWIDACLRAGLADARDVEHMRQHAFDLRGGDYAADYVLKFGKDVEGWSAADELTRVHAKLGLRRGRFSPFQMLVLWQAGEGGHLGERFREFAAAFEGKRQLHWSPKLKARLGVADKSDEDIAAELGKAEPRPDEDRIARLSIESYATVYSRGLVPDLLELVRTLAPDKCSDPQAVVDDFVRLAAGKVPLWSKRLRYRPYLAHGLREYAPP